MTRPCGSSTEAYSAFPAVMIISDLLPWHATPSQVTLCVLADSSMCASLSEQGPSRFGRLEELIVNTPTSWQLTCVGCRMAEPH